MSDTLLQALGLRGAPCPQADVFQRVDAEPLGTWISQIVTFQVPADRYLRIDDAAGIMMGWPQRSANLKTTLAGKRESRPMPQKLDGDYLFFNYPGKDKPKVPVFVDKGSEVVVEIFSTEIGPPGDSAQAWAAVRGCLVDKVPAQVYLRSQPR